MHCHGVQLDDYVINYVINDNINCILKVAPPIE